MLDAQLDVPHARVNNALLVILVTSFLQSTEVRNVYKNANFPVMHALEMYAIFVRLDIFYKMVYATQI